MKRLKATVISAAITLGLCVCDGGAKSGTAEYTEPEPRRSAADIC